MSSSNCHPFHICHPKWANPQVKSPGLMLCWAAGTAAWLHQPSLISWGHLQVTCDQSQQCLMMCCCLAFSELAVSVLFPWDVSLSSRKIKPVSGTTVADLAEAMPPCLPASLQGAWQSCLCHHLSLGDVTHFSVQTKYYWADFIATALFHLDGSSRAKRMCGSCNTVPFV